MDSVENVGNLFKVLVTLSKAVKMTVNPSRDSEVVKPTKYTLHSKDTVLQ